MKRSRPRTVVLLVGAGFRCCLLNDSLHPRAVYTRLETIASFEFGKFSANRSVQNRREAAWNA